MARFASLLLLALLALSSPAAAGQSAASGLPAATMLGVASLYGAEEGLAVLDAGGRVRVGKFEGSRVEKWQFLPGVESASAIAGDETGLLLVVSRKGEDYFLSSWRMGESDKTQRKLKLPRAMSGLSGAAAGNGMLWLVFRKPVGVLFFAYDGMLLGEAEGTEFLRSPYSVALSGLGEAFVTDPMGPSIVRFRSTGQKEQVYDLTGTGMTRPTGIAVGSDGAVLVSDGLTGGLARLKTSGSVWDLEFSGEKNFDEPLRICTDNLSNRGVFALEARSGKIGWLKEFGR
ncbi:hypothetical protein EPN96_04355 [bacterium]|nr:MAG: hypothetical protein EPN96_04355 [bacterium]